MINPIYPKGRYLFIRSDCKNCAKWHFIYKLNNEVKLDKRVRVVDCTKKYYFDIYDDPIIKRFEDYFDAYPAFFFDGEMIPGANTEIECKARLVTLYLLTNSFYFEREPEYLPEIDKHMIFAQKCKFRKGRVVCV